MKTLIFSAVLVLVGFGAANAQSNPSSWAGSYEGMESSMNATETRSTTAFAKLDIECDEGVCIGEYSDGENSDTYNKYALTIKGTADSISFFYSNCQPTERDGSDPCTNSFKEGDLMFKLVKGKAVKGKSVITTVWGKLKKETLSSIFFEKSTD